MSSLRAFIWVMLFSVLAGCRGGVVSVEPGERDPTGAIAAAVTPVFTSTARIQPASLAPGGSVGITAAFTARSAIRVNVDVEARDGAGTKVFQRIFTGQ